MMSAVGTPCLHALLAFANSNLQHYRFSSFPAARNQWQCCELARAAVRPCCLQRLHCAMIHKDIGNRMKLRSKVLGQNLTSTSECMPEVKGHCQCCSITIHHLPVKASWYDQEQVCSCQIAMRNVPIRSSVQGCQEDAKLISKLLCSHF